MNSRTAVLKRINVLYGLVEEMHSVVFRQTTALVQEVDRAIALQEDHASDAANVARSALIEGDRQQWFLSRAQQELSGARLQQLETVRIARVIHTDKARDEYRASRMKSEQMKSVIEHSEVAEELIAGRRTQSAADDWFLSRLRWKQVHDDDV